MNVSDNYMIIRAKDNFISFQMQFKNQVWVTVLKFISFNEANLKSFVIWKDAEQQLNWYNE